MEKDIFREMSEQEVDHARTRGSLKGSFKPQGPQMVESCGTSLQNSTPIEEACCRA